MTRPTTVRRCLAAGVTVLSLGLAACGGDDSESSDTEPVATATPGTADGATATTSAATTGEGTEPSGDGGDVDVDAYVDAAVGELDFADEGVAECLARSLFDNIDPAEIAASGASPEEFVSVGSIDELGITVTDDMRATMRDDAGACDGLEDELVESEFGEDPEVAACVSELLTDEIVADVFVAQLTNGTPSDEAMAAQTETQACAPQTASPSAVTTGEG